MDASGSSAGATAGHAIYALQVQAFLEAADDVDVDVDTVEDLLDGFEQDDEDADATVSRGLRPDADDAFEFEENDGIDDPEYNALVEEAERAWTAQEVRHMKHHLKEKGMTSFTQEYAIRRGIPIPQLLAAFDVVLCKELRAKKTKTLMYFLRVAMSRELHRREKIPTLNTFDDAADLIRRSNNILILTGAGISVSCGIPDFRSRNGLYAMLKQKGEYELDDPQQMFDLTFFKENPSVFYSFASQIYPSNFTPSPCHRFIKLMEDRGKLLRNYTQNIDTLETLTGIQRVLQCHGSFSGASCLQCRTRVPIAHIEPDIFAQRVPLCAVCNPPATLNGSAGAGAGAGAGVGVGAGAGVGQAPAPRGRPRAAGPGGEKRNPRGKTGWGPGDDDEPAGKALPSEYPAGIMKPDITFFGEKLADEFETFLKEDREKLDLLLVIGTSLKVAPVADILLHLPHSIPQILINKTPVKHINPDIILLGDADAVVHQLCAKLAWDLPKPEPGQHQRPARANLRKRPSEVSGAASASADPPRRVGNSHVWLFDGAEGGKWLEELERAQEQPDSALSSALSSAAPSPTPVRDVPEPAPKKRRTD